LLNYPQRSTHPTSLSLLDRSALKRTRDEYKKYFIFFGVLQVRREFKVVFLIESSMLAIFISFTCLFNLFFK